MSLIFFLAAVELEPFYYTNHNYFYDLIGREPYLYGATNGGVVRFDYQAGTGRVLTSRDGLRINRQRCLAPDAGGGVWVGNDEGLAFIDAGFTAATNYPVDWLPSQRINTLVTMHDTLFVGTTAGLLRIETGGTPADFDDDIRTTVDVFAGLPSNDITALASDDSSIWVGTALGLVRLTKDLSEIDQYNLIGIGINALCVSDSSIYAGTTTGLHRYAVDHFDTLVTDAVGDIAAAGDSLILAMDSARQVGLYRAGQLTIINAGLPSLTRVHAVLTLDTLWFCGLGNNRNRDFFGEGIGSYAAAGNYWELVQDDGPGSNHISCIAANRDGVFMTHGHRSALSRGFSWLQDDGDWVWFRRDSVVPFNNVHRCVTAPDGRVWFATNPIERWVEANDTMIAFAFDPVRGEWSYLRLGYQSMDQTTGVWDIESDAGGNLYLSLAGPSADRCWVVDSALERVVALSPKQDGFFCETAVDSSGRVWRTISEQPGGLIVTDTKSTLFETGDDDFVKYESPGNFTKNLRGCIVDRDDNLYIATPVGLVIYDGTGFRNIAAITQEDLFDVELDSENRIWIMARDGIYWYEPATGATSGRSYKDLGVYIDFDTTDREVIQTQGFEFDPIRRCFWIGGETGLVKLAIKGDSLPALDSVVIFPNPVVGQAVVRIAHLPANALVNIYSIGGRCLARGLAADPVFREVVWPIPPDAASGIYFVAVRSGTAYRTYKFAIAR